MVTTLTEPAEETQLIAALRRGDESAFVSVVEAYGPAMQRVARLHVSSDAVAAEVVQEAWLGVLQGLDAFEGRSSVRTWVFRILLNRARTRGEREARTVPLSTLSDDAPAVAADRFLPPDHAQWPGHWGAFPLAWGSDPEARAESAELFRLVERALESLPPAQARVMALRDVAGLPAEEVCSLLELSTGNQRVLLHRARARVRDALERMMGGDRP